MHVEVLMSREGAPSVPPPRSLGSGEQAGTSFEMVPPLTSHHTSKKGGPILMQLSSSTRSEDKWMSRRSVVAPGGWCCCSTCCWCHCNVANQAVSEDAEEL
jgi:streptolysin S family bacteriocin protoxin